MAIYPDKSENVTREKNTTSKTSSACNPNVTPAAGSAVEASPMLAYSTAGIVYQYLYIRNSSTEMSQMCFSFFLAEKQ